MQPCHLFDVTTAAKYREIIIKLCVSGPACVLCCAVCCVLCAATGLLLRQLCRRLSWLPKLLGRWVAAVGGVCRRLSEFASTCTPTRQAIYAPSAVLCVGLLARVMIVCLVIQPDSLLDVGYSCWQQQHWLTAVGICSASGKWCARHWAQTTDMQMLSAVPAACMDVTDDMQLQRET